MFGKILCRLGLHDEVKTWKTKLWQEYVCLRRNCEARRRVIVVT